MTTITTICVYLLRKKKVKPKFNIKLRVTNYENKNKTPELNLNTNVFHVNNVGLQKSLVDFTNQAPMGTFQVPLFKNQVMPKISEPVYYQQELYPHNYNYQHQPIPIIVKKQKIRNRIEPSKILEYPDEPIYVIDTKKKPKLISNDLYSMPLYDDQIKYVYHQ